MQDTPGTALPIEAFATLASADLVEAHEACKSANTMLLETLGRIERKADALIVERDAAQAEVESLRADALRYRWLRDNSNAIHWTPSRFNKEIVSGFSFNRTGYLGFKFEEAIDAAMKGTP